MYIIYRDYTLCITQMLSRHVLLIFSFHQNGSPEIIHRERVGNSSPSSDSSTVGLRAVPGINHNDPANLGCSRESHKSLTVF